MPARSRRWHNIPANLDRALFLRHVGERSGLLLQNESECVLSSNSLTLSLLSCPLWCHYHCFHSSPCTRKVHLSQLLPHMQVCQTTVERTGTTCFMILRLCLTLLSREQKNKIMDEFPTHHKDLSEYLGV